MKNIDWGIEAPPSPKKELSIVKEKDLISIDNIDAAELFVPEKIEAILKEIENKVAGTVADISTEKGRKALASVAYKVARSKTAIDERGKDLVAEWKKKSNQIDDLRKKVRDHLDGLRDKIRKPLDDYEQAENKRRTEREDRIRQIENITASGAIMRIETIETLRGALRNLAEFDWQEFEERANAVIIKVENALNDRYDELKKLEEARILKEEQIKREAAERAREEIKQEMKVVIEKIEKAKNEAEIRADNAEIKAVKQIEEKNNFEKLEEQKRAADLANVRKINNEILSEILKIESIGQERADLVKDIIRAIMSKKIPHIFIKY